MPSPTSSVRRRPLRRLLRPAPALVYRAGPFVVAVDSPVAALRERVCWAYGPTLLPDAAPVEPLIQFHVGVTPVAWLRRPVARQVMFRFENRTPFEPYPYDHAFPLLEWGTNWCIAQRGHQFLMLHAGVVERDGLALLLPALPGSGKTTLTVALAHRGWRFLSDEFALIALDTGAVHPLPRAAPVKNASIDVIRRFAPDAELGSVYDKTRKGTVAHLRPPADALARQHEAARPAWVLFPRYAAGAPTHIEALAPAEAFTRLAFNSFNYRLLGAAGFDRLTTLVGQVGCFSVTYSDLDDLIGRLDQLPMPASDPTGPPR